MEAVETAIAFIVGSLWNLWNFVGAHPDVVLIFIVLIPTLFVLWMPWNKGGKRQ